MTYDKFEDLPSWQAAAKLYNHVLDLVETHGKLLSPGFRNQLDRAALSVSNNIAEGFERTTTKELLHFIGIARGSAGEVRSMMAVVKNRHQLRADRQDFETIEQTANDCIKQLMGWTKYLEASPIQGNRHTSPK